MRTTRIAAMAASVTLALGSVLVPAAAHADQQPTSQVIAQDVTPAPPAGQSAPGQSRMDSLTATPNAPQSLQITAAPRTPVTITAPGTKARSVTTNKKGKATVKKLVAGRSYTIKAGSDRVTATPLIPVTAATGLRVATTDTPGNVELTWKQDASPAQGAVTYRVSALPISDAGDASALPITAETTQHSMVLIGLDLATRYQFTVTPVNALGAGTPTTAVMASTLGDITGTAVVEQPRVQPQAVTPAPAPRQPQPAPQPVGPATRTIYVCADGFTEVGGLCEKVVPYTYTTIDYTYHGETRTEACSGPDCPGSVYYGYPVSEMAPHCPQGGTIHGTECFQWTQGSHQVTYQVKDATPAGFTDNGTAWTQKDAMPAGYTDNGTAWVLTAAKEARVVPA